MVVAMKKATMRPLVTADQQSAKEARLAAMKTEVEGIMESPAFQDYAMALVLGTQLYAWAHHYIMRDIPGSEQAKRAVIATVNHSMMDERGNPRPFDECHMSKILGEQLESIQKATKRHVHELEAREKEMAKLADDIAKDAIKT